MVSDEVRDVAAFRADALVDAGHEDGADRVGTAGKTDLDRRGLGLFVLGHAGALQGRLDRRSAGFGHKINQAHTTQSRRLEPGQLADSGVAFDQSAMIVDQGDADRRLLEKALDALFDSRQSGRQTVFRGHVAQPARCDQRLDPSRRVRAGS